MTSVNAARAFQFLATTILSIALVVIVVAAFMAAPMTGKLGLAAGITLLLFSLFELIAFSLIAAFVGKRETEMPFFCLTFKSCARYFSFWSDTSGG